MLLLVVHVLGIMRKLQMVFIIFFSYSGANKNALSLHYFPFPHFLTHSYLSPMNEEKVIIALDFIYLLILIFQKSIIAYL